MCGILAISGFQDVIQDLYDGLMLLQHRGQGKMTLAKICLIIPPFSTTNPDKHLIPLNEEDKVCLIPVFVTQKQP